jgi:hypothetical protein
MNLTVVISSGLIIGLLLGAGVYFEPSEPYKLEVTIASTIRSTLVALLTAFSLSPLSSWYAGIGFGVLYGAATGLVVFLAKGGFKSKSAPFVVPGAGIAGGIAGLIIVNYGF